MDVLFWLLLFGAVYSYFIYPLLLLLLNRLKGEPRADRSEPPSLSYSLIVTVYNEEQRVLKKLDNIAALQFDANRLEVIVASDGSDDATDSIVKAYPHANVRLVRTQEHLGKENAQLAAIEQAQGDVLVFSDVATEMDPDAIDRLDYYFADPAIGAVSSEDRFISQDGTVAGEGAYVKYEMWLRKLESNVAGLVGLSGSFFAARKTVCEQWDIHSPSDFNTALNCARLGLRSVSAPDVLGYYQDLKDPSKEYARKVRTVLRGMTGLARHMDVMNVFRLGWFSVQVISHKLMRWLVPWCLLALFIVSALVADNGWFYQAALVGQVLFYITALLAHVSPGVRRFGPAKLVYFFVQVNIALMDSATKYFSGTRMTTWKPSSR